MQKFFSRIVFRLQQPNHKPLKISALIYDQVIATGYYDQGIAGTPATRQSIGGQLLDDTYEKLK